MLPLLDEKLSLNNPEIQSVKSYLKKKRYDECFIITL